MMVTNGHDFTILDFCQAGHMYSSANTACTDHADFELLIHNLFPPKGIGLFLG
jgi:hypothetical protein